MSRRIYKALDTDKPQSNISFKDCFPLTTQSCKEECDINKLIGNAIRLGGHLAPPPPADFKDLTAVQGLDTFEVIERGKQLMSEFFKLPSKVRDVFQNDPRIFLKEIFRPERRAEFEDLGLFRTIDNPTPEIPEKYKDDPQA